MVHHNYSLVDCFKYILNAVFVWSIDLLDNVHNKQPLYNRTGQHYTKMARNVATLKTGKTAIKYDKSAYLEIAGKTPFTFEPLLEIWGMTF